MHTEATPGTKPASKASIEQRKRLLVAQGAMYRLGLSESRHQLAAGLRVDLIAKSALSHVLTSRFSSLGSILSVRNLKYLNFSRLKLIAPLVLPLLTKGVSTLARGRTPIRSLLFGSVSLASLASAGFLVYRWRKVQQQKSTAGFRTSRSRSRL
jgi:hypothetical protein